MQTNEQPASLLLVDDDITFCQVLSRALDKRGFAVTVAHSVEQATPFLETHPPAYAVFDLKMTGASGLVLVEMLHRIKPDARIVVLSGYGSIATAVDAVRLGAIHFLAKPANADEVVAAFSHTPQPESEVEIPGIATPRQEAEYLARVLSEHGGNITQTAKALNMHRRSLQRKLNRFQNISGSID